MTRICIVHRKERVGVVMLNPAEFTFFSPTCIEFGFGKIEAVGQVSVNLGAKRILVVSDPGLREVGVLDRVLDLLETTGANCASHSYGVMETNLEFYCIQRERRKEK